MADEKKLEVEEEVAPAPIEEEEVAPAPIEEEEVAPAPVEEETPSEDDLDFGDLDEEFASKMDELAEDNVFSEDYGEYAKGFPDWDLLPPDIDK